MRIAVVDHRRRVGERKFVASASFVPSVLDVNDVPTGVSIDNTSIAEGATAGDVVGHSDGVGSGCAGHAVVPDGRRTNADLPNGDDLFEIVVTNGVGELKVKAGVTLTDLLNVGTHEVYVMVTDGTVEIGPQTLTITIDDINNAPTPAPSARRRSPKVQWAGATRLAF